MSSTSFILLLINLLVLSASRRSRLLALSTCLLSIYWMGEKGEREKKKRNQKCRAGIEAVGRTVVQNSSEVLGEVFNYLAGKLSGLQHHRPFSKDNFKKFESMSAVVRRHNVSPSWTVSLNTQQHRSAFFLKVRSVSLFESFCCGIISQFCLSMYLSAFITESPLWAFCLILPLPHKTAPDGPIVLPGWIKFLFDVHLNPFPFSPLLALSSSVVHVGHTSPFHKAHVRMLSPIQSQVDRCRRTTPPPPPTHHHRPLIPLWLNPDVRQTHVTKHTHVRSTIVHTCDREVGVEGLKPRRLWHVTQAAPCSGAPFLPPLLLHFFRWPTIVCLFSADPVWLGARCADCVWLQQELGERWRDGGMERRRGLIWPPAGRNQTAGWWTEAEARFAEAGPRADPSEAAQQVATRRLHSREGSRPLLGSLFTVTERRPGGRVARVGGGNDSREEQTLPILCH